MFQNRKTKNDIKRARIDRSQGFRHPALDAPNSLVLLEIGSKRHID